MAQRALFGGAIAATFPTDFVDVSDLRQVPDNQEVFVQANSNVSIVVEVLERVSEPDDMEAARFHFEALAHDNDAVSSTMQDPFVMHSNRKDQPSSIILHGSQRIRKFNASTVDDVDIFIALFRIHSDSKSADLVVSQSIPKDSKCGVEAEFAVAEFVSLVSSFRIIDYNLFC